MATLYQLQREIQEFPTFALELRELDEDGISGMMSRPATDTPYVSGCLSTSSPVENFVIRKLSSHYTTKLVLVVEACFKLYKESNKGEQVTLVQVWKGKHTSALADYMLKRYAMIRGVEIEDEPAYEKDWEKAA